LNQKINRLHSEINDLYATKSYLAQEIKIQQASVNSANQRLNLITATSTKNITLKGMNLLDGKLATIYWNMNSSEVYFNADNLTETPAGKQYQLWAIVNGKPVDMGVIDIQNSVISFQKMKSVKDAQAFAVTVEKAGGSPEPTLSTMCLLGNV
jgi:hypothetical protein